MANFRARARTVDLLGRQQIAGIPTAISELFKNAHDAYADRVQADYLVDESLFLLRDDGVGMSGKDFEERWLVLGTESKVRGQRLQPDVRPGYQPRPLLGEKGIGRLAIASVGPALLALMRPYTDGVNRQPIWGSFIHWGIFEIPAINLDDIEIPVVRLGTKLPDAAFVRELVEAFAVNLVSLPEDTEAGPLERIQRDLDQFALDPRALNRQLAGPSLEADRCGVQFFVKPTDDSLDAGVRKRGDEGAPELTTTLIGFMNTMSPDSPPPRLQTGFRVHRQGEPTEDLIAPGDFFTPEEFRKADHHIEGRFDEEGVFEGTVSIYGAEPEKFRVVWPGDGWLECGPFGLSLAVVNPEQATSMVASTDFTALKQKMERLGGLYVYRDDVRILPYGRPDHDWLEIEQRRSKHAGRAFLSHRRMFGAVMLDGEGSRSLEEKAGREGFRDNRAYRQFRDLLIFFLRQVVTDFFTGKDAEAYKAAREDLERKDKAKKDREARAAKRRDAFEKRLTGVLRDLEERRPAAESAAVVRELEEALMAARRSADDQGEPIATAERVAYGELADAAARYRIDPPTGFGFDGDLRAAWSSYEVVAETLDQEVWDPARAEVSALVGATLRELKAEASPGQRLRRVVTDTSERARQDLDRQRQTTEQVLETTSSSVHEFVDRSRREFDTAVDHVLEDLALHAASVNGDFDERRRDAEISILKAADQRRSALTSIAAQLRAVRVAEEGGGSDLDALDALEEELIEWRERGAAELELAQLGMGIQIVGHEFNSSVGAVRAALRQLKPWADANDGLKLPYGELRTGFEHLEGYLRLLAPLQRRLNRRRSHIKGREIADYVETLFERRLEQGEVELRVTDAFARHDVVTFRSTIYPVFTALVDNAMFWVSERKGSRWIEFDADGDAMYVSNSGPPIPGRDRERVFEMGFSRRPGGQGMGLFVVHESLKAQGFTIDIVDLGEHWVWRIAHSQE
ncbi:MAG TPA: ATP-binding protein [Solirubrobacterales bacterium]|jgi:signal transduction histidine kinase|nr:ATP-binding protein [Solirubrobacterales bacterium]